MHIPRCLIAGLSGGSGKTMLSLGLARAFSLRGLAVRACKKGPDYIDAAWLALAAHAPSVNLDPFFMDKKALRAHFTRQAAGRDLMLVEGNRGLFDGLDREGSCSSAELARWLEAPVVLVMDCTKMTRTAAALVKGCLSFEPGLNLAGVICNRIGNERHAALLRRAIEDLAGAPVLGLVPRRPDLAFAERHMGLAGSAECQEAQAKLDSLAAFVSDCVNLDALLDLARSAPDLPDDQTAPTAHAPRPGTAGPPLNAPAPPGPAPVRLGYVRDAAFWFYYEENLVALQAAGARLIPLSLLDDQPWPDLDGLYIGGGLPELHAARLAANAARRGQVAALVRRDVPVYAECGGLMYLCRFLIHDGKRYPMAGVLPADVELLPRPQGLGYVTARCVRPNPFHPEGLELKGHEFHFSRYLPLDRAGPDPSVLRLSRGAGLGAAEDGSGRDGLLAGNTFASYMHLYAPAAPHFAPAFVDLMRSRR